MELGKNNGGPGILNAIPSTLYRWIEECRVLDGASVHDVVTGICHAHVCIKWPYATNRLSVGPH